MYYMAFSDDIRETPTPQPTITVTDDQVEVCQKMCKRLKMRHYVPDAFENPALQSHFKLVESLALLEVDEEEDWADLTLPPLELQARRLATLSEEFNRVVQPSQNLREQMAAKKRATASTCQNYPKKARIEECDPYTKAKITHLAKTKKLTAAKVADLQTFLKSTGTSVHRKRKDQLIHEIYEHLNLK